MGNDSALDRCGGVLLEGTLGPHLFSLFVFWLLESSLAKVSSFALPHAPCRRPKRSRATKQGLGPPKLSAQINIFSL